MRLLATADLHYNHAKSRPVADALIDSINAAGTDVLLLVGDTAAGDGDALEQCLSRFTHIGPRLFVAGNHELWTLRGDSEMLYREELPRRVEALGWQWLETRPFVSGPVAIVGSVGWYDYGFASPGLRIPNRFYAAKVAPGTAAHFARYAALRATDDDVPAAAREVYARWNDGRYVHLGRSDETFLFERLAQLRSQLDELAHIPTIVAAVHHVPFAALMPPTRVPQWDFAHAFLGSPRIGELLLRYPNVRHALCGHSHFPAAADLAQIHAVNIGSGYRWKTTLTIDFD